MAATGAEGAAAALQEGDLVLVKAALYYMILHHSIVYDIVLYYVWYYIESR